MLITSVIYIYIHIYIYIIEIFGIRSVVGRSVHSVMKCGFWPFLASHFAVWFSQIHNYTAPHFCNHMCDTM